MGRLKSPNGEIMPPSVLESTRYLPSLHNAVWTRSDRIAGVNEDEQAELDRGQQVAIRRARIGVEILKRPSDEATKFDLFQRLNAGGTVANAQELRNSIVLMINADYFRHVREAAESVHFRKIIGVSEEQEQRQRHIELAMRFLVHTFVRYDGKLDVEEYIDEGVIELARTNNHQRDISALAVTFDLLWQAAGANALRRFDGKRYAGKVGLVALEVIAVGIAQNIERIRNLDDPRAFVEQRIRAFWADQNANAFTSPGVRGTTRIQRTVPFGAHWFQP